VVSLSLSPSSADEEGIRPVNLRTDLAAMADLIELVFADSMDSSGRAAIREMRSMSRLGPGLSALMGISELQQNMGFVYIADGRLIGNVSIYPAPLPASVLRGERAWIIANVGVHPDYRRRGIARRLMETSLNALTEWAKGRRAVALLQVERDNLPARRLYESLNFVDQGAWTTWRRSSSLRAPQPLSASSFYITRRRRGEWRAEYALAQRVRPAEKGGIGWLRPLHPQLFRPSWRRWLNNFLSLRSVEHLIIRADADARQPAALAALWIESAFAAPTQLTLMVDPAHAELYAEALINLAVRRFGQRDALVIEHPADDAAVAAVLSRRGFVPQRTLIHMSWKAS
jgi:ribosomal protein S18 acetylase RimI-like enzyme